MANSTTTGTTTTAVTSKDMKSKQLYLSMPRIPPKVYLKTVNPHITCNLCKGYLIDATTIVECLHSFCHSCIMMHLRHETYCPSCEMLINKVKPNIKPDATLQAIVYKLVPGLYEKELLRRRAFYKPRTKEALQATPEQRGDDTEHLIFGPNENISLMLEYSDTDNSYRSSDDENSNSSHEINSSDHCDDDFEVQLRKPKYLQCPAIFTISNLKKFLLHKFSINPNKFCVEIMYKVKTIALPDYYTLMDVAYIYTWKRDAPMKFFYCVRAAHLVVASVDQNAVIYDLPSNRFQTNSRLTCVSDSTDQDQSSDADSEVRAEGTKKKNELGTNGPLSMRNQQNQPINSTSIEDAIASSSSTSLIKSETLRTPTHSNSLNGSESQKKEILDKIKKEPNISPTTSNRLESPSNIKSEGTSPEKQPIERRSNGTSPKPQTFKSRSSSDVKQGSSPSRTNLDNKDSKERVKTKSHTETVSTKSSDSSTSRTEQKTALASDKSMPSQSRTLSDSKPLVNIDRSKSRLIFNKEDKSRSFSPPLSAENEYDFDQHLLKEKLSEKKKFLSSIHLTPRIPSSTETPLVQLPKTQKTELIMNLSKDNKPIESNSIVTSIKLPISSSSSSSSPSSSSSSSASLSVGIIKKPENKASKRKSREPVKNVAKVKCSSPSERLLESKWETKLSPITYSAGITNSTSTALTSSTTTMYERLKDVAHSQSVNLKQNSSQLENAAPKDKNNSKPTQSTSLTTNLGKSNLSKTNLSTPSTSKTKSPITFKTPASSSSTSKDTPSSTSETSIIINNVQRPNQADTPRPSMQFKPPNLVTQQSQPYFFPQLNRVFSNETEIQEIRNDDASKLKVYGPAMGSSKSFDSPIPNLISPTNSDLLATLPPQIRAAMFNMTKQMPINYPLYNLTALQQLNLPNMGQSVLEFLKNNKNMRHSSDMLKSNEFMNNIINPKLNTVPNLMPPPQRIPEPSDSAKHQNVHSLLTKCKIPSSLSITVTNDETESMTRSIFNNKNSNVVNSIEIVKLPDESSGELNARFPSSITTSSPSNLIQAIEKETARTNSPGAINLGNNHATPTMSHTESFQAKFLQTLIEADKVERTVKKTKPIKPNRPLQQQQQQIILEEFKEAQKRKQQSTDDMAAPNKVRKLQRPIMQSKSSPTTQRPIPDLVMAKDEKRIITSDVNSSTSPCTSTTSVSNPLSVQTTSKKLTTDRKSPNVVTSGGGNGSGATTPLEKAIALVVSKTNNELSATKYSPLQTSSTPFWKNHSTPDQMASHKALIENLTQNKKSSGTFVD